MTVNAFESSSLLGWSSCGSSRLPAMGVAVGSGGAAFVGFCSTMTASPDCLSSA
eukprot:CAMPEP_0171247360 /NCGR_PEP_ID=MMETSP0790-20130122/48454_1 /TAXON_ID=2925 /ORGANISM="Alexandrium catenella, Strain OF101" /LENGTH=53 /DNA_ID=CAMNT_0011714765 /DNA_START=558 /DNA_END=715 /DNA_ORIENTATION=+